MHALFVEVMIMKKIFIFGISVLLLFASLAGCQSNNNRDEVDDTVIPKSVKYEPPDNFLINSQKTPEIKFGQHYSSGDYGITDFCIMQDNTVLILDTMDYKIYRFGDGELIKIGHCDIDRSKYNLVKIATDNLGNIYIVSAKAFNCFIKIEADGNIQYSKLGDGFDTIDLASTVSFSALDEDILRVTCYDMEKGGFTNITVDISGDISVITDILDDYFLTDGYIYNSMCILDPGDEELSVGHSFRIETFDLNMTKLHDITLTSENWIFGGKCHGKSGDDYIIEITELDDNNDFHYYLALADGNGMIESRYNLPLGSGVSLKTYNGVLYLFVQTNTDIKIKNAVYLLMSDENGFYNDTELPKDTGTIAAPTTTPDSGETSDNFLIMGYISNIDIKNKEIGLEEIEWLTSADSERLEELGINELFGGFYIYKPDNGIQFFKLSDNAKFEILNEEVQHDYVDVENFINNIHDYSPYQLEILNGEAVSIKECYLP